MSYKIKEKNIKNLKQYLKIERNVVSNNNDKKFKSKIYKK